MTISRQGGERMTSGLVARFPMALLGLLLSNCVAQRTLDRNENAVVERNAVSSLSAGWNALKPGGRTSCADGSDYSFFVRPADTTRVLLFFQGGGACWNGEDCERRQTYTSAISSAFDARQIGGILDFDNRENPFANYTMVVVPYCTGDLHLGERDNTYVVKAPDATVREVLIR